MGCESRSGSARRARAVPEPGWGLDRAAIRPVITSPSNPYAHQLHTKQPNFSVSLIPDPRQRHHSYPGQQAELRPRKGRSLSPGATGSPVFRAPGHAASPPPAPSPCRCLLAPIPAHVAWKVNISIRSSLPRDAESCSRAWAGATATKRCSAPGQDPASVTGAPLPPQQGLSLRSAPSPAASPS